MNEDLVTYYLSYSEQGYAWHAAPDRSPDYGCWTGIGYGKKLIIDHFMKMVNIMRIEFGMKFTDNQIIRLAECTPGITVWNPTPVPEDDYDAEDHMCPIDSKNRVEECVEWKAVEK